MVKNKLNPGSGLWIWILKRYRNGEPLSILSDLRKGGFTYVNIKIADWTKKYNQDVDLKGFVSSMRYHGIEPWGWQYIYGINPAEEAKVAARYANELGLHGFIINAEKEFNTQAMAGAAKIYMDTLKQHLDPSILVGLSSYRFPYKYQRNFTWREFLGGCDFYSPQVYWMLSHGDAHIQLDQSIQDCKRIFQHAGVSVDMPIRPTGAAFTEHGWTPTVGELSAFMMKARELKIPAIDWWEAGNSFLYAKELYNYLINNPYDPDDAVEPPSPPDDGETEAVFKAICITAGLYVRSGPSTMYSIVGDLREGDVVDVYEVKDNWFRIGAGMWCSGYPIYMRRLEVPLEPEPTDGGIVEVTANALYMRSTPVVTDETIVGHTTKGKRLKVIDRNDDWTRVEVYVSSKYTKEV